MKLDDINEVAMLRNHRKKALALREASNSNPIEAKVFNEGVRIDVFSAISAEPIRAAISNACTESIIAIEARLKALGVYIQNPEPPFDGTLQSWRDAAHMYCSAWTREMKGHIPNKRHRIDALVLGTQELIQGQGASHAECTGEHQLTVGGK